jgi:hypothetical protein
MFLYSSPSCPITATTTTASSNRCQPILTSPESAPSLQHRSRPTSPVLLTEGVGKVGVVVPRRGFYLHRCGVCCQVMSCHVHVTVWYTHITAIVLYLPYDTCMRSSAISRRGVIRRGECWCRGAVRRGGVRQALSVTHVYISLVDDCDTKSEGGVMWPAVNRTPTTVVGTYRTPTRPQRGSRRGVLLQQPCRGRDEDGLGWRCRRAAQCGAVGGCGSFVLRGAQGGASALSCYMWCGIMCCADSG